MSSKSSNQRKATQKREIGFIGLGLMGYPMAINLLRRDPNIRLHVLTGRATRNLARLRPADRIVRHRRLPELARQVKVCFTMLPAPDDVRGVVLREDGLISGLQRGSIVVDCSTSSAELAVEMDAKLRARGCAAVDSPVSGLPVRAEAGTLAIMVGARQPVFKEIRPLLEMLGTPVYIGAPGAGQITKAVSQLLLGLVLAGIGEGVLLARKAGIDVKAMMQAIMTGVGATEAMRVKGPNILRDRFEPGFYLRYHLKDLNLAMQAAAGFGLALPFTGLAREFFRMGVNMGYGQADDSAILKVIEEVNQNAIAATRVGRRRSLQE